jgi:hydrogenase maturation protein HypF
VNVYQQAPEKREVFAITKSDGVNEKSALIAPDTSVCDDCRREMSDPGNRRYRYPFINCTNCGPRYTIICDIPYDRPNTSMREFEMCPACQAEYDDPTDRRFHAQPNACPVCGPQVTLFDHRHRTLEDADPVQKVIDLLTGGYIVAIKGLGGFHLAVDATNETAVTRLRQRKIREEKPLALMAADLTSIRRFALVTDMEASVLTSRQRPIVLLRKRIPNNIAPSVAPRSNDFGVMLPYTPLHYLLLDREASVLVMTSGNRTDEPIAIANDDAFDRLADIADYFLVHNRDIYLRSDDSLVRPAAGAIRPIRRARGYVPIPVFLHCKVPPILALGAELKNTVCLTKVDRAFISQHIGDLENVSTHRFFEKTIDHLTRILDIRPEIVACDMHPDYLSTVYARKMSGMTKIMVQHHHAHIVSAMTEHGLSEAVIGLAFDGTGYGPDGHVWGGEILIATPDAFKRVAQLAYVSMPGSTAAIREPWRMAVSYLDAAFGDDLWNLSLPLFEQIDPEKIDIVRRMIIRRLNTPQTSSLGRLFDGVAALAGIRHRVTFEGQAAMELEGMAVETKAPYSYEWEESGDYYLMRPEPIIRDVVESLVAGESVEIVAGRFHATLVQMFAELTFRISQDCGINRIVLSGGVFQNARLLAGLVDTLYAKNLKVYTHSIVPTNDGGICLGQAMVAAALA